jgi:hypothetical protein
VTSTRFTNRLTLLFLWIASTGAPVSRAADVVFIDQSAQPSFNLQQMETAATFYGLDLNRIEASDKAGDKKDERIVKAIRDSKTVAVVIMADALPVLSKGRILSGLKRGRTGSVPLLIAGVTERTDPELLRRWSAGAITGGKALPVENGTGAYAIAAMEITRPLGGYKLPLNQSEIRYLVLDNSRGAEAIMAAISKSMEAPVFARAKVGDGEIFFLAANEPVAIPLTPDPYQEPAVFAKLAPQLMFLHYAGGEHAWHSPGKFANLTIDDLWLRQPYGYVDYTELLRQMQSHHFHTTLAFIPWNFDRSEPAVVSLLRAHPELYSVCVHGNNHNHQEFGPYETHPRARQVQDIKQGIARMARFSQLTQIPYDAVMVFPHSISPEPTLGDLKRYNFLATANSLNVPSGSSAPTDPEFGLRTVTLAFSNFPSLRRYSAEASMPESQLAIEAFLGNPILFYVHQGFFAAGVTSFNAVADRVNELQPDTQWRSLGYIAKHLYLEKLRDDGNYDVRTYCGTIRLDNTHKQDVTFFIEKEEDFALPLTVRVDGQPYTYQRSGKKLLLQLAVRAGMSREITIAYENDLSAAAIDVSKGSFRINSIRQLSDLRDDVISKTPLGRWFIRSYHDQETDWNRALGSLALLLIIATIVVYARRLEKRLRRRNRALLAGSGDGIRFGD